MFEQLMKGNAAYVAEGPTLPSNPLPARALAVVTCMDARIDPLRVLGLEVGDAKVLRNAGGRITDEVLAGLVLVVERLGVRHIAVVHHTGCAAGTTPEDMSVDLARLRAEPGLAPVDLAGFTYDVDTGEIIPNAG